MIISEKLLNKILASAILNDRTMLLIHLNKMGFKPKDNNEFQAGYNAAILDMKNYMTMKIKSVEHNLKGDLDDKYRGKDNNKLR